MRYLLVLLLAGCASQQLTEEQGLAIIATYGPRCEAVGLTRGSEPWLKCMSGLYQANQPNLTQSFARGLQGAGGTLNPQVYQTYPTIQNTNCTTTYLGTNCTTTPY